MRILRLLLIFFLMPLMVSGATITGSLVDLTGSAIDMDITFKSLNPTGVSGPSIVVPSSKKIRTQNGQFTISLLSGQYQVISDRYNVYAEVPSGDGTYALQDLVPGMITFGDISGIVAVAGITNLTGEVLATGPGSAASVIATNAVTNVKIAAGVDAVKISAGDVTNTEFDFLNGVTSAIQTQIDAKQATGNYVTSLTGDVTAAGPGASVATIANNSVTNPKVSTGIDAAKLGGGNVSNTEFDYLNGVTSAIQTQLNAKQASGNYVTALTGDVTASGPGSVSATIASGVVNDDKLAANAVTTIKILDAAITNPKIATNSVDTTQIIDDTITSADILDDAVISGKIEQNPTLRGTTTGEALSFQIATPQLYHLGTVAAGSTVTNVTTHNTYTLTNSGSSYSIALVSGTPDGTYEFRGASTSASDPLIVTLPDPAYQMEVDPAVEVDTFTIKAATLARYRLWLDVVNGQVDTFSVAGGVLSQGIDATDVDFVPSGTLSSTNVQSALTELDTEKVTYSDLHEVATNGLYSSLTGTPPNANVTMAFGEGSSYNLETTANQLINLGTKDPVIPITAAGDYLLFAGVSLEYSGATLDTNRVVKVWVRRSNNTAADLNNSTNLFTTGNVTTNIGPFIQHSWIVPYTTSNTNDSLGIYAQILSDLPSAGNIVCRAAYLHALRINQYAITDATAPTVVSITIPESGNQVVVVFDEPVQFGVGGSDGLTLTMSGGAVNLSNPTGSGTITITWDLDRTILSSETGTADYSDANGIEDLFGNDLANFAGTAVTNNSTESGFTAKFAVFSNDYMTDTTVSGDADGTNVVISGWVKFNGSDAVLQDILRCGSVGSFTISRLADNTVRVTGRNVAGTTVLNIATTSTLVAADGWTHLYVCISMAAEAANKIYFDGASQSLTVTTFTTGETLDLTGSYWRIGAGNSGDNKVNATLAEWVLFFAGTTYADTPTAFASGGSPIDIGVNGETALGITPTMYFSLSGDGDSWANDNSGRGNTMTITGALGTGDTPP